MGFVSLAELKKGQKAVIKKINASGAMMQKFLNMGIVKGEPVEVIELAPFSSPIECKVNGVNVSFRREEAEKIQVEIAGNSE